MQTSPNPVDASRTPPPAPPVVPIEAAIEHPEKVGHPDRVPHDIVGFLAYAIVVLAAITLISYLVGGPVAAFVVGGGAGGLAMVSLLRRSRRERVAEAVAASHDVDPDA